MTYTCKNHPPRRGTWSPIPVRKGVTPDGRFIMGWHQPRWQPGECQHDRSNEDPGCNECRWQKQPPTH